MIERVIPSVVAVFDSELSGGGSGVLIDSEGYGLTNYHVVAGMLDTRRGLGGLSDGEVYDLEVLGIDPTGDVANEASGWTDDVVLVGHLPFMGRLAARLVAGREDPGVAAFRPGGMLCLERGEEGGWEIAWMLRPELTPV
ncbi:MAG: hypothetical protein IH985_09945 [Planctomycetes bacterium]|nr:hypothetical protein [Planctomycetota bacterium]